MNKYNHSPRQIENNFNNNNKWYQDQKKIKIDNQYVPKRAFDQ